MAKNETKLSSAFAKQLKGMGFNCKSEEDARAKLLAALEKEGVDGMEDETLQTLIDMVDGFRDTVDDEVEDEIEEVDDEVDDVDSLADEVEDEEAELEKKEEVSEKETVKIDTEEETPKGEIQKMAPKRERKTASIDVKNNPSDKKLIVEAFNKMFPEGEYLYVPISNGMSVKYIGENSKRLAFSFMNMKRKDDTVMGNLYLNALTKELDKLNELGIEYILSSLDIPFVKAVTIAEANDILKDVVDIFMSLIKRNDKRLGKNRKKMEANLEKSAKKS